MSKRAIRTGLLTPLLLLSALLFAGCPSKKQQVKQVTDAPSKFTKGAEDYFQEALSLHRQYRPGSGNPDQIISLYKRALENKPEFVPALYNLAALYEDMGKYRAAAGVLADALRADPNHAPSVYRLAQVYVKMGQYRSALGMLRRYLKLRPQLKNNPKFQLTLAEMMIESGEYENALKEARKILSIYPKMIEPYRIIAKVYFKRGNYKGVLFVYEIAESLKKKDAQLENIKGLAFLRLKKLDKAFTSFDSAAKLDPQLFAAQMNLGTLALKYYDKARALHALQKAVQLKPRDKKALLAYAVALRINKKFPQAEKVYKEKILKYYPNDLDALLNLGILYVKFMNKPHEGKKYLRRFIGEKTDITNDHLAYKLLKEAEVRIRMLADMKRQQEEEKKKKKSKPAAPAAPTKKNSPNPPPTK